MIKKAFTCFFFSKPSTHLLNKYTSLQCTVFHIFVENRCTNLKKTYSVPIASIRFITIITVCKYIMTYSISDVYSFFVAFVPVSKTITVI